MPCTPWDFTCQASEALVNLIVPYIIPAVVFIVALVGIIAARTLKGKGFWLVVLVLDVWWFVPLFGVTLRQLVGL